MKKCSVLYFELEQVKKGVFGLAEKLYGITFRKNTEIPVYHKEVEAFEVFDKDGQIFSYLIYGLPSPSWETCRCLDDKLQRTMDR